MEKQDLWKSHDAGEWIAHLTSEIFNPFYVAVPLFLILALVTAPDVAHALLWWVVAAFGISLLPYGFILYGMRKGKYTDHFVSKREQRLFPLLIGMVCMGCSCIVLFLLHARVLLVAVAAVVVILLIATLITQFARWKISLHLVGIAGAVTLLCLLFGPILLVTAPLIVLVGWARWKVGAHTPLQAIAGTCLSVSVTLAFYWFFKP
jgi:membrane-associated phospholipid phosphatase